MSKAKLVMGAAIVVALIYIVKDPGAEKVPEPVEEIAEPFLVRLGFLARTPRGRVATPPAWRHLGLVPPTSGQLSLDQPDADE